MKLTPASTRPIPGMDTTPAEVDMKIFELRVARAMIERDELLLMQLGHRGAMTADMVELMTTYQTDTCRVDEELCTADELSLLVVAGLVDARGGEYFLSQAGGAWVDKMMAVYARDLEVGNALRPLDALYEEHLWVRWYMVQNSGGHLHNNIHNNCGTCFATTRYAWEPLASGATGPEAVEAYGMTVCSACFPDAPALKAYRTAGRLAAERAEQDGKCVGRLPVARSPKGYVGDCECGATRQNINGDGKLRTHDNVKVLRAARLADPKLITDAVGDPLMVLDDDNRRQWFKTVRAAEIEYVSVVARTAWTRPDLVEAYLAYADRLAAPLAAKAGVEVEAWKESMEARVAAKVKRDAKEGEKTARRLGLR